MTALLEEPVDQSDRGRIEHETASTLFVEAGAGSGKTYSMVSRICRLVLDEGVELDRIAAISFTEKAAAELRERLRARISGTEDCERRDVALGQVDTAAIGTLHSFAARIVSEHPLVIGVPPRIRVVDEMGSRLAFERRWQRIRARLFPLAGESSDVAAAMKVMIAAGASLDQLRGLADRLDRHWDRLTVPDRPLPLRAPSLGPILQQADSLLDCLDDCTDRTDRFAERLTLVRAWRDQLAARREGDAWLTAAGDCPTVGNGGAGKNWRGGTARVKELKQQLKDLAAESERVCAEYRAAALDIVVAEISRVVLSEARDRKRSGELEFHDLLVYARDIARHDEAQAALHTRYQRILLDEFQDTDPLQLELAEAIVAGAPGRLFTVGDPKQSIYRFRRADIATYMAARDAHEGRDETAIVRLTTNFRSSRPVLDWVNAVFEKLMVAEHHTQAGYTPLDPAPGRPQWDSSWGPEPFVFCNPMELEDARLSPANALRSAEAQDVARVIATALDQKWCKEVGGPVGTFEHVPLNLSDVCILIPARASLLYLEDAFDNAGIEFRAEASSLVYSTQEIHDLLLTARALSNHADSAALVAALRTPLFGCGDDDLFRWKSGGGAWRIHAEPPAGLAESPVARGLAYLRQVWQELPGMNPGMLLTRLAADRRMFEVSMGSPRHRDVWRRLRFVIDQAHAWYRTDGGNLRDYLAWATAQQEDDARVTEAVLPEVGVNAVRIMTMHAAKGLQFPMVVIAGMSGGFKNSGEAALWDADGELHVNLCKEVKSLGYGSAAQTEAAHIAAERVRLLYVASTRAESFLAVSGYQPDKGNGWGTVLAPALESVPNTPPELLDGAGRDDYTTATAPYPVPWEAWRAETLRVAASSSVASSVPATDIAHGGSRQGTEILGMIQNDGKVPTATSGETVRASMNALESGTVFGTAVHALLESIDLTVPLATEFNAQAATVVQAAGLSDLTGFVAVAKSALNSAPVKRAATREHWQEMQLAGSLPDSDTVVEGVADLVYREDDQSLVIIDYKTDVAVSEHTLEAYWAQLSVYADLLTRVAGERVSALVLLFLRSEGAEVLERRFDTRPDTRSLDLVGDGGGPG